MTSAEQHIKASLVSDKGTWAVRARFPDTPGAKAKQHSKSTGLKVKGNNKRKAEAIMRDIVAEWEQRLNAPLPKDNPPMKELIELWLDRKKIAIRPNTLLFYRGIAKKHVIPFLGDIGVCDLTRQTIQNYFDKLSQEGQSGTSMRKHRVIIHGVLKDAVINNLVSVNVADSIDLPKRAKFKGKALSETQVAGVLDKLTEQPEPLRAVVTLALAYGLRRSEICGLRWQDVDFEHRQIHIRNTITEYNGEYFEQEDTKTKASCRDLFFVPGTEEYLFELKQKQEHDGVKTGKVCAFPDGRFVRPEYVSRATIRFLKSRGIEGIRFHDLRHTTATILAKLVPIKQVQAFLGHEDIQTTLNIYTHIMGEDSVETSNAMGKFLNKKGLSCSEKCSETDAQPHDNIIPLRQNVWKEAENGP